MVAKTIYGPFRHCPNVFTSITTGPNMLAELAIADAYGAGVEYADRALVRRYSDLRGYVKHPRHRIKPGCYADDTQMSLAIAELVVEGTPWNREAIARKFVEVFKRDPRSGYAGGFHKLLRQVATGEELLARIRPQSDKSGAAMRAGPLGVLASIDDVLYRCEIQARITHDTADGVAAAQAASLMSHYFLYHLGPRCALGEFVQSHVAGQWAEPWTGQVGSQGWMSVRAAITAITRSDRRSGLLRTCVGFCGDVDTAAAIAMAAGAHCVEIAPDLPEILINRLEDGPFGRRYLSEVDRRLLHVRQQQSKKAHTTNRNKPRQ